MQHHRRLDPRPTGRRPAVPPGRPLSLLEPAAAASARPASVPHAGRLGSRGPRIGCLHPTAPVARRVRSGRGREPARTGGHLCARSIIHASSTRLPPSTDLAGLQVCSAGYLRGVDRLCLKDLGLSCFVLFFVTFHFFKKKKRKEGLVLSFSCFGDARCAEPIKKWECGICSHASWFPFLFKKQNVALGFPDTGNV